MSNKDWTGNKNSIFKTLGASNHTEKERKQMTKYGCHDSKLYNYGIQ